MQARSYLATALALGLTSGMVWAQGTQAPVPVKGDRGVAIADAGVPRPTTQPCVVSLYSEVKFNAHGDPTSRAAHPHTWDYAPPAKCAGPWSKVVLEADFSVNAGRQYDRTASLWLDGVNLYFGTTQEPSADVGPHWHIERDVTDYASLFRKAGQGQMILNNWVSAKYTGVIKGSARLVFYPAAPKAKPTRPADQVMGLVGAGNGHPVGVQDGTQALSRTFTLPRNVERAYLDVIAQSQAVDEQWYMCIDDADVKRTRNYSLGPPNAGDPLEQCGGGNYREVAVSIDGQPAGRAPVYPWTYTGGVNPLLWRPTPDIQTLNFKPYRVDLTPFASVLDDGKPHTVSVRVLGAHDFFSVAANLLIYRDHGRKVLTGKLIRNTLAMDPARLKPEISRHWSSALNGHIDTVQHGDYMIEGELQTSHGPVRTLVSQQSSFANRQHYKHPDKATWDQVIDMDTQVSSTVTTQREGSTVTHRTHVHYPLRVDVHKVVKPDGNFSADITMKQGYQRQRQRMQGGHKAFHSTLDNQLVSQASAEFNAGGTALLGTHGQHGNQVYRFSDSLGSCYARRIATRDQAVTKVSSGQGCPGGHNHLVAGSKL
ncbi:peptide-N4-asparagine amidase [Oleiagrimonas sp. C23AA]|uniref:peptide-N4-asparagine amidase n=1 Tax=Oleiagrimonas sp. C23AA TaxID=2719047 RepID=UPI00141E5E42|nr:peptide-N4-asparagine amidase [Oleiagrimonas sp. C23AA]NII09528.1 peptide-N(4)-(N-acetyl-beta-glucosaminyl)asparagine amidase [Oleiagrimonas sp. C23AA]